MVVVVDDEDERRVDETCDAIAPTATDDDDLERVTFLVVRLDGVFATRAREDFIGPMSMIMYYFN